MPNEATPEYDITLEIDDAIVGEVDAEALTALLAQLLAAEDVARDTGVSITIAGDELLHELNLAHRGVDAPTDVLSFATEEGEAFPTLPGEPRYLGDIAVSLETVRRNAVEAGLAPELELHHVLVHGVLHLLGYDHETPEEEATMRAREEAILGAEIHAGGGAHTD